MAYAAIDMNGETGDGIAFAEFSSELVNQGIIDENDLEKIERIFHLIDLNHDGFISREEWQTAFEIYPSRLGNINE